MESGPAGLRAYVAARPNIHRALGPTPKDVDGNPTGRIGSHPLPGAGGAALAFSNPRSRRPAAATTGPSASTSPARGDFGFDTLFGNGTGGAGSDLAIMPAVDASSTTSATSTTGTSGSAASNDLNIKTGWLGRWIDATARTPQPAAGDLDRHGALEVDPHVGQAGLRDPVAADGRVHDRTRQLRRRATASTSTRRCAGLSPIGAQRRQRVPDALARDVRPRGRDLPAHVRRRHRPGQHARIPHRRRCRRGCRPPRTCWRPTSGTRVITIHWGGFDTHTGQLASQDRQLIELSRALGAFKADLTARGIEHRVSTLVFSEFGRRVRENGDGDTAGTDHGAGGLMMAMGSAVRGGFASRWPGCETAELVPRHDEPGQSQGPDRLPLGLLGRDRGVVRRRPGGGARRPGDRHAGPR